MNKVVSAAKVAICDFDGGGKSAVYMLYNKGESEDPCGTPAEMCSVLDEVLFNHTANVRPRIKLLIILKRTEGVPNFLSL